MTTRQAGGASWPTMTVDEVRAALPTVGPGLSWRARSVMLALAHHVDADGLAWPSAAKLAQLVEGGASGGQRDRIRAALAELAAAGQVTDTHERRGRGRSTVWAVHPCPVRRAAAPDVRGDDGADDYAPHGRGANNHADDDHDPDDPAPVSAPPGAPPGAPTGRDKNKNKNKNKNNPPMPPQGGDAGADLRAWLAAFLAAYPERHDDDPTNATPWADPWPTFVALAHAGELPADLVDRAGRYCADVEATDTWPCSPTTFLRYRRRDDSSPIEPDRTRSNALEATTR